MSPLTVFDEMVLHPLIGDLPTGWLQRMAVHGRSVVRPAGHRLFDQGDPAERFWLVRSGAVDLRFRAPGKAEVVIDRVGVDSVTGCSGLVPPFRHMVRAVVTDQIRAVEFGAAGVRDLIGADPALGLELTTRFAAVLARRLESCYRRLAELDPDRDAHGRPQTAGPSALF